MVKYQIFTLAFLALIVVRVQNLSTIEQTHLQGGKDQNVPVYNVQRHFLTTRSHNHWIDLKNQVQTGVQICGLILFIIIVIIICYGFCSYDRRQREKQQKENLQNMQRNKNGHQKNDRWNFGGYHAHSNQQAHSNQYAYSNQQAHSNPQTLNYAPVYKAAQNQGTYQRQEVKKPYY